MKNRNFYIFRHALATHSKSGYGDKIISAEILPEAIAPIEKMANFFKNISSDYNVSSEYLRCRETAEIISEITNKNFIFDSRLNEFHQETFPQFKNKISSFLDDIKKKRYKNILICTHGAVIAGLKNFIVNGDFNANQLFDYSDCGVLEIIENGRVKKINFNL
ncbi:MAG: histidine phosphatase family protein [Candidatus Levybacteria bacterium]|nr:histidine phosphatase family protein [Candidatus Levybacteria bacterium]